MAVAVVCLVGIALPFVLSLGDYLDVVRQFRDAAEPAWKNEAFLFLGGVVALAVLLFATRRFARATGADGDSSPAPVWRSIAVGAVVAGFVFAQVGLQLTRFTPQVGRDFYYPETHGEAALRKAAGHDARFIGSGMGTFAPNTAMTEGLVDARSHSFRDPQWKKMILAAFPDALGPDPLKINVDFRGKVNWGAPVFDDMALGIVALSSSEVPLGDRHEVPKVSDWARLTGDEVAGASGPAGAYVGVDLMMRTTGDCLQGAVVVEARTGNRTLRSRRPITDARAAGVAGTSIPFALPLGDIDPLLVEDLYIHLDGAPRGCVLEIGRTTEGSPREAAWAAAPITRPADAPWEMVPGDWSLEFWSEGEMIAAVAVRYAWPPASSSGLIGLAITTRCPRPPSYW